MLEPAWKLALRGVARTGAIVILFLGAGRVAWPRGWIFTVGFLASQAITFAAIRFRNPGLIRLRLKKIQPTKPFDKVFVPLYGLMSVAFLIVAGLDGGRYSWSRLGPEWIWPGLLLHAVGTSIGTWAAVTNPYLKCTVETRGHSVVATGPYRILRHPMYASRIASFLGWPLILGSLWSYLPVCAIITLFFYRTTHEDQVLRDELAGYQEYCEQTPYRLLPGTW
jgi:protein-S-isoprenylcysteine O-methyltransferase Ste14